MLWKIFEENSLKSIVGKFKFHGGPIWKAGKNIDTKYNTTSLTFGRMSIWKSQRAACRWFSSLDDWFVIDSDEQLKDSSFLVHLPSLFTYVGYCEHRHHYADHTNLAACGDVREKMTFNSKSLPRKSPKSFACWKRSNTCRMKEVTLQNDWNRSNLARWISIPSLTGDVIQFRAKWATSEKVKSTLCLINTVSL